MAATNAELTEAVLTISSLLATVMESHVFLAEIVIPAAPNLSDQQKAVYLAGLADLRTLLSGLQETANQLKQS
ncbi:MAG: hypothetical protein ABR955_15245 [Verrucomicrobiota bacterium]|jgi:hypothetical protein